MLRIPKEFCQAPKTTGFVSPTHPNSVQSEKTFRSAAPLLLFLTLGTTRICKKQETFTWLKTTRKIMARHWKGWRDKNWLAFFFLLSGCSCRLLLLHPTWDGEKICITTMKYYRLCLERTLDRHALETLVVCCLVVCDVISWKNASDCVCGLRVGNLGIQSYRGTREDGWGR